MAQGTIRKGFFFYFGLFVLLLITVFLICLVIMIFNPGKTVLWMQYFTANDHFVVEKTSEGTTINYDSLTSIEIDCGFANVSVQRNKEYSKNGIHIINNAKGFTGAANAVPFSYQATVSGSMLKIEVVEPSGFLYFSKDVQIILNANTESSYSFDNVKFTVKTVDGDITLGNASLGAESFKLSELNASASGNGSILLGGQFGTSDLTSLSLESASGRITSTRDVTYAAGKTAKGIYANCDMAIKTNNGRVNLGVVNIPSHNLSIDCKKGDIAIDFIRANETAVACVQGNYKFGTIEGNLNYENSEDTIISPNIMAEKITGNFLLSTTGNVDADPDINFKEVDGSFRAIANKGRVLVKKACSAVEVLSENQLVVDIIVAESNSETISITNESGEVKLGFLGGFSGNVSVVTNSAKITFNVTNVAKFVANSFVNDNTESVRLDDNKISVSHGLSGDQTKNPLTVSGTGALSGNVKIVTNSSVDFNLVTVDSLK